ncbi:TolC family outer membrane protein [Agarilytica rhodophyticola]|uniref:TolC family outer membrane protein n=1 Tax=Agarilytica rhodophyticola TaxID=1737490 RepID=UPI000B34949A|nr:TolC family outer membrane protein [Agarilytica rhodophyticola]
MNSLHVKALVVVIISFVGMSTQAYTLSEAVEETLKTNPRMLSVIHELQSRTYEVKQARAEYLPTVNLNAGVGEETRNAPVTGGEDIDLTREELSLQAEQLIFDGFGTNAEIRRQKARVESLEYVANATAQDIALRTAEVYINVLRQKELLDLTRATLWEHQNIYDQMKLRSDKGVGSKADLDQIAARLALANANMVVAQNNLADAQANFFRVAGFYPNLENMAKPEEIGELPESIENAVAAAVEKHPTLHSATADFKAAQEQYKAAGSRYWPTLRLEAEKRWDENIGGIEGEDEDLIVALRLQYNLYNGGADRARRKQTAKLIEQSKDIRNNSRRQVVESTNLSWNAHKALSAQMTFLEGHYKAATSTKAAYAKQFNIGRRTLLDLLNTETEVVEAKRALINAQYDQLFARYRIFNALGTLLAAMNISYQ